MNTTSTPFIVNNLLLNGNTGGSLEELEKLTKNSPVYTSVVTLQTIYKTIELEYTKGGISSMDRLNRLLNLNEQIKSNLDNYVKNFFSDLNLQLDQLEQTEFEVEEENDNSELIALKEEIAFLKEEIQGVEKDVSNNQPPTTKKKKISERLAKIDTAIKNGGDSLVKYSIIIGKLVEEWSKIVKWF